MDTIVRSSIISDPPFRASPVKLQKRWQIFPDVLRHWSTFWYWYHRRESYTLLKQASDYTWWPIIDGFTLLMRMLNINGCGLAPGFFIATGLKQRKFNILFDRSQVQS